MTTQQPYDDVIRRSPRHQPHHHLLPQVLLVKPPLVLAKYLPLLDDQFDLIKAYESPLPINDYLSKHGNKVKAMICSVGGKRVGIIGLGSIGIQVAKRVESFGCSISYNFRKPKPSVSYPFYSNVRELASNSDILIICCALTPQTHHIINKEVLQALGKNGVVVNIARGGIIDEKELVKCLVEGETLGAGLDVFENEPNVPAELFSLDNVVLSPHRAVLTPESVTDLYKLIVRNLEAFFSNKPLINLVEEE